VTAKIPPAPEWYHLVEPEGLDGFDRFMYGPAPKMPREVIDLAYRIGVRPGDHVRATRVDWRLPIERATPARRAYEIPIPFGLVDLREPGRRAMLETFADATLKLAGEPDRVRDLLEHAAYLAGRAVVRYVEVGRGWCSARVDQHGRRVVRVEVAGDEHREPADLDAIAELVPLVEPRSERLERWRERGDS
jgi:hypothetical protein